MFRKIDRQSERLEKQTEKRESLREVREEEYWSGEKATDGSAFAYEQQGVERRENTTATATGGAEEGRGENRRRRGWRRLVCKNR